MQATKCLFRLTVKSSTMLLVYKVYTHGRPPFTLPATLPVTRIFSHYPTRTLPEVKKPYPSQPASNPSFLSSSLLLRFYPHPRPEAFSIISSFRVAQVMTRAENIVVEGIYRSRGNNSNILKKNISGRTETWRSFRR